MACIVIGSGTRQRKALALLLATTTAVCSSAAFAQQQDPPIATPHADEGATGESGIKDIVVTARFRNETLQNTPVAISAVNAATIQNTVVTDVNSIQKLLPNVQLSRINYAGQALGASIRGISFADLEKTFDPAIGVSIDGVFLGTNTGANVDFDDIETIEVLRGPQGTLYGRNTIGGTISIRHTKPTGELGFKGKVRYGSFNSLDLDGVVNLPKIGGVLAIKLFGLRRTSDSFTRNRYTGKREPGRDIYTVGGTALADFGDTTVLATVGYTKDRSHYASAVNLTKPNGLPFGAGGTICDYTMAVGLGTLGCEQQGYLRQGPEQYKLANTSIPFASFFEGWNASLEINSKLGSFNLTAITGFRSSNDQLLEENTGTPPVSYTGVPGVGVPLFVAARDQNYKQFSQEIRVQGNVTDWMDVVAGVYYLHTKYNIRPYVFNGSNAGLAYLAVPIFPAGAAPFFVNAPIQAATAGQTLDSYAAFAESIFKLGSNVRLTVGGRYTIETKDFFLKQTLAVPFSGAGKKTFRDPTGRVILDWKPNADTMLYASWSRGFRSGGFNGRATTAAAIGPYNPERVDSYEAGIKASFADGRVRINPTVFWVEYNNKQEEILRPAVGGATETVVQNAAKARTRGVELEIQARPVPELTVRAAGAYLDARYKSFIVPNLAVPGTTMNITALANFRRAPKYTFNAGFDYEHKLSARNSLQLNVNYSYIDKYTVSPRIDTTGAQRDTIASHTAFDVSLAFVHHDDSLKTFRLAGFARDVFHGGNRITNTLDAGVFYFGAISPNRELGLEATIQF